jgi:carbamoyltransferase
MKQHPIWRVILQKRNRCMNILGISAYYHDSAATLVVDGRIRAAAQEERFTRIRHDSRFPDQSIRFCLRHAGIDPKDLDFVAFYDKPFLKFERLLETYLAVAPRGFKSFRQAMPLWLKEKLFQKRLLSQELSRIAPARDWASHLLFSEHHLAHAASAFYPSPFEEATVLTMDGVGEWTTTSIAAGRGSELHIEKEIHFPHSIGLLYSAFTYYTGFKVNSGEYKVMGLAPYGVPRYRDLILEKLIDLKPDGSFRLNLDYFGYCDGLRMTKPAFDELFDGPARAPESPLTQRHMDLAASIQSALETILLRITRNLASISGSKNLCLAGGVALNCVANSRILKESGFERIWIQPAAGDAGGAIGAALAAYHIHCGKPRTVGQTDLMQGSFLGPEYNQVEIQKALTECGARFESHADSQLISSTAEALASGNAVGWFQGQMEFGPRSLGSRSILGDPRAPGMQRNLNLKVKFRESFRPFAPSVRREDLKQWFDLDVDSPYMLLVADVLDKRPMSVEQQSLFGIDKLNIERSSIPAVTHIDYSARVQTVHADTNPRYHALITAFHARTGCPVLVNTSFNVRGEPIVCTPADAFGCFMGTGLDLLAIGNCILRKEDQDPALARDYRTRFNPD